ncbi:MAG: radical SAM protein [Desulfobacterales bacterium]|nr:MAG: radical SAM protein [Desulfobacterales bacterium]
MGMTKSKEVSIVLDGKKAQIPAGITVKKALEISGYKVTTYPAKDALFAPCETGGCWSCAVEINNELKPACVAPVKMGQKINTKRSHDYVPKRIVHGFSGHTVGGVGTPYWFKGRHEYIEVACFAAGCNLRCLQCQNWETTFTGKGHPMTPEEAAELMTATRRKFKVDRMAISGGESTLNRRWLVDYVKVLKRLNPDHNARIHVDTNTTILTKGYIDELVQAGMTDIGPDLKGYYPETFMRITSIKDKGLAVRYLNTAWGSVQYLIERYKESVFTGVGIPYNKELIKPQEIGMIGEKLYEIDPEIQVCVLDYRPEYNRVNLVRPSFGEMVEIQKILTTKGLKTVICQTEYGHIGPE